MYEAGEVNQDGLTEKIRGSVQGIMNESFMPTLDYKSTTGIYGGRLTQEEGKLVWNNTGLTSKIDRSGDIKFVLTMNIQQKSLLSCFDAILSLYSQVPSVIEEIRKRF